MANNFVTMLDNFYPSPYEIRELALSLDFTPKQEANYPGGEAYSNSVDWEPIRQELFLACIVKKKRSLWSVKTSYKENLGLQTKKTMKPDQMEFIKINRGILPLSICRGIRTYQVGSGFTSASGAANWQ